MRNLERRFSLAFNAGPEPMTISKLSNSVYVDVNEAFLRITGYRREEILGQSSLALKFWASPERRHALLDKLRKGPAQDFEITFMTKSGERRSGLLSAQTIEVDGQPCLLAVTKDITERKQAEEELKRLNRDLRTICECNQALVRASEEPELLKRICEILVDHGKFRMAWVGYAEQDEAKRVPPVAFAGEEAGYLSTLKITWADAPLGHGPTGTCIRNRQPALARYIRHDPSMAPWREEALKRGFESSIGLPLIAAGKTLGALTLYSPKADAFDAQEVNLLRELADDLAFGIAALRVRDERERAEQALRKSEDRYRDLVEHSRDLICTHDLEGRLLSVNPEPARILGYSTEELLSTWLRDLLAPEARSQFDAYLERIQRQGEDQGILRVRCRDGRQRIWEYHNTLRTEGLTRPIVRGLAHDITDRLEAEKALKKTQEQFLQAQKMEAVGRLAGGVAHDFNNLLTVINGYSDLLLAQAAEGSDERARLEEIKKAGDRAAALTRQLLAFSRKQVVMPAVLDLNLIVEGMEKMLRRLIGEDIEFVENLSPSLGRVRADAGQIEQVIMNLAVNARDAMPKGGKLTIEATNVQLGEEYTKDFLPLTPGSYVLLAISDTGCGMDAETQSHIFEPFFTTKGQGTGTGLGLSTAYGIVKQSGGIINVYSEVGRGTTFKVYLKRVGEPTAEGLKTEEDVVPSEGTETVLLVEDEPAVRSLAQMTLQAKGYTVLVAGEYIEAMTLARQHAGNIHLLLTDVIMPGLNGRELADLLLALRPTMKVLFISGYTADAIAQHGILDEGVAFLPKPFTPRDLLRRVRQILDAVKP